MSFSSGISVSGVTAQPSSLLDAWGWAGTGVAGFYSILCCCCTAQPLFWPWVCPSVYWAISASRCGGQSWPHACWGAQSHPPALGSILGTGVRQMRSAVPSVGYRNWVVLKEMLYKGLKLAGWKKKSAKYSRLSVDTSRLPPEGVGSLIIVF